MHAAGGVMDRGDAGTRPASVVRRYERLAHQYDHRWQAYTTTALERLLAMLRLSGNERVLDVGCGTGAFEQLALDRFAPLNIVGLDLTPAMVQCARRKLAARPQAQALVGRAEALPFPAGCFDVVVSANMLHHVPDAPGLLQECARVLRLGGRLGIVDWCRDYWHCGVAHHWLRLTDRTYVRMYRLAELRAMAQRSGLIVEDAVRFLAPPAYGLMGLLAVKTARAG